MWPVDFTYIYHEDQLNVSIHSIHGSYGIIRLEFWFKVYHWRVKLFGWEKIPYGETMNCFWGVYIALHTAYLYDDIYIYMIDSRKKGIWPYNIRRIKHSVDRPWTKWSLCPSLDGYAEVVIFDWDWDASNEKYPGSLGCIGVYTTIVIGFIIYHYRNPIKQPVKWKVISFFVAHMISDQQFCIFPVLGRLSNSTLCFFCAYFARVHLTLNYLDDKYMARWWFYILFIVTPTTFGNDPIWLVHIFQMGGSTTNQMNVLNTSPRFLSWMLGCQLKCWISVWSFLRRHPNSQPGNPLGILTWLAMENGPGLSRCIPYLKNGGFFQCHVSFTGGYLDIPGSQ